MRFVIFSHSLVSDWNHGNAHFLRGIVRELTARGHHVRVYEPRGAWSRENLIADRGPGAVEEFRAAFPTLDSQLYDPAALDLDMALDGADVVLVHEWNDHDLVARIGAARARGGRFRLLFHDTHHRTMSDPHAMARYDLSAYDGVLAYGAVIAEIYRMMGWGRQVWVWHEAADTALFRPLPAGRSRATSCGSAIGATASARWKLASSCFCRSGRCTSGRGSTVCAIPPTRKAR
ncbi:MAG TPA: glycosyltransferase [Arenibaculum sp.]|nr:glycosyltransferase [Arenibaculum sp.]